MIDMQTDLAGKVAFVAGSTAGIGKAIALKLAENGANIVLNGRKPEAATEMIEQIKKLGRRVIFEKADITVYAEVKQAVDNALEKLDKIEILVASGGVAGAETVGVDISPDFFQNIDPDSYELYAKGGWWSRLYCVKAVLGHMVEKQKGKIIMITTDAGRWPTPVESLAGGTGAALIIATKVLAQELARSQIRINTICLPPIENTPSYEHVVQLSDSLARMFKKALTKQPFPVTAEDIAEAALFFSSDESDAITGQILSVNGGLCFPG